MAEVTAQLVKELRETTQAGMMDCKKALLETAGDMEKAIEWLREKGLAAAAKKASRIAAEGIVGSYYCANCGAAVVIEVNCETDFVARTDQFKEMAHCLAMQVAAMAPVAVSKEDVPEGQQVADESILLLQAYIKDPTKLIKDVVAETIAKTGENIKVRRFVRFELGN